MSSSAMMPDDATAAVEPSGSPGNLLAATGRFETILMADEAPALKRGTRVGPYEIERLLGCGGMSKVYLARQLSMNRMVALKVITGIADNPEQVNLFLAEIKITAKISCRHVVSIIEAGVDHGNYFFSMNHIDGHTLDELVERDGPMTEDHALEIVLTVAESLKYLHDRLQICHKDIKPGNIMTDHSGEVFLLDFGIAGHASLLEPDAVVGSPFYMSPEQICGEPLDWRTDLYSLGTTFFAMICGVAPYDDDDVSAVLQMHLQDPFPMARARQAGCQASGECLGLIKKMMSRRRDDRHRSWEEFIVAARELPQRRRAATVAPPLSTATVGNKRIFHDARTKPPKSLTFAAPVIGEVMRKPISRHKLQVRVISQVVPLKSEPRPRRQLQVLPPPPSTRPPPVIIPVRKKKPLVVDKNSPHDHRPW